MKEGKAKSNVVAKIVIEQWVVGKATDFTFGSVHKQRIEILQKQRLQSTDTS